MPPPTSTSAGPAPIASYAIGVPSLDVTWSIGFPLGVTLVRWRPRTSTASRFGSGARRSAGPDRGVVAEDGHEGVDVAPLEAGRVAGQQRPLSLLRRPQAGIGVAVPDPGPRPLQGAVDRGHGGAEKVRQLARPPAEAVARDRGSALPE